MSQKHPQVPEPRKGQGGVALSKEQFVARLRERFYDPLFDEAPEEVDRVVELAWRTYSEHRKSPRRRKAGPGFADPEYELPVEWLEARERIVRAQERQSNPAAQTRVLLVCASARNDQTCPSEMSKTYRLTQIAQDVLRAESIEVDLLDLSHLTAEYGRQIFPCKACVSTAMPLCHWPCSCYPNHSLGQVNDWMNELYPRWVAAHGVMIVTPVYWYQAPAVLKLMMDRLVCADGGNPDPTTTKLKHARLAKELELRGWKYPRHLAGRAFSVVVHGDTTGTENLRRMLTDWLTDMHLVPAGRAAQLDRYIGYYEPYSTSHEALDEDHAFHEEVRNAARSLAAQIALLRTGGGQTDEELTDPRPK